MAYNMQAEGINGVTEKTVIVNNGWGNVPAPAGDTFVLVGQRQRGRGRPRGAPMHRLGQGPGGGRADSSTSNRRADSRCRY
jgi:hypothetical protein